jgi:hypothetical protein
MALFTRSRLQARTEARSKAVPPLGSGRRLTSQLSPQECLARLEAVLLSDRSRKYIHMPAYVVPGWVWNGEADAAPASAVACDDNADDFLFVALWPSPSGTELGLFPLGSGDDRLRGMPIIRHWKQRDQSLSSVGVVPSGLISLRPPVLPPDYLEDLLATGGYPATPRNVQAACQTMNEQFVIKAFQFIDSRDRVAADRFVDAHRWYKGAGLALLQSDVDDLATWDPGILPDMQDLPMRVRAIVLDVVNQEGTFWSDLDRLDQRHSVQFRSDCQPPREP